MDKKELTDLLENLTDSYSSFRLGLAGETRVNIRVEEHEESGIFFVQLDLEDSSVQGFGAAIALVASLAECLQGYRVAYTHDEKGRDLLSTYFSDMDGGQMLVVAAPFGNGFFLIPRT